MKSFKAKSLTADCIKRFFFFAYKSVIAKLFIKYTAKNLSLLYQRNKKIYYYYAINVVLNKAVKTICPTRLNDDTFWSKGLRMTYVIH